MGRNVGDPICPPVMVHGVPDAFPRCRPWAAPPARSDVGFRSAVVFCPFPVDGMWSCWSSWSTCSATCGGGHYMRTRSCTNPAPAYGGDICLGLHTEEALCNTQPCPGKQPLPAQRRGQGDFGLPLGKDCPQCRRSRFDPWVRKICWRRERLPTPVFLGFPCGSAGIRLQCGRPGLDPWVGKIPWRRELQYSGLENSMDYTVHGVQRVGHD